MTEQQPGDLSSATRALADAVSEFTRTMSRTVADVGHDVNDQLASTLRTASQELNAVSTRFAATTTAGTSRAERTRSALIEAARKLFAERGYESASLGDVAAEAGYTKGAVYANFASKEALLLEVARDLARENDRWLAAAESAGGAAGFGTFSEDGELSRDQLLAVEITLYAARHPEVREEIAAILSPGLTGMVRIVAAAHGADPETPSRHDLDTAVGVLALRAYVQMVAPTIADTDAVQTSRRLIQRLLADSPADDGV